MKLRPLNNNVLVRLEETASKSTSIVLPDSAKERPQTAVVIAVGAGSRDLNGVVHPIDVKVGDVIAVSKYGGREMNFDGQKLYLVGEQEILAVLEELK